MLDRSDKVRRAEGVVDYERQTVSVSDFGESVDVGNVAVGIAEGLDVDRLGVRLNCCCDFLEVMNINEGRFNSVERKGVREKIRRAAIDRLLSYDMIAVLCESLNRVGDCRRSRSESQTCNAALKSRDPVLKNALS